MVRPKPNRIVSVAIPAVTPAEQAPGRREDKVRAWADFPRVDGRKGAPEKNAVFAKYPVGVPWCDETKERNRHGG